MTSSPRASAAPARIAVGLANRQLHAVLDVNFGSNFYVLDTLTDEVQPVERSAVRILSAQSVTNSRVWLEVPGSEAGTKPPVSVARVTVPSRW